MDRVPSPRYTKESTTRLWELLMLQANITSRLVSPSTFATRTPSAP